MLKWLRNMQRCWNLDGQALLRHWHEVMELDTSRKERINFFEEVVETANSVSSCSLFFPLSFLLNLTFIRQLRSKMPHQPTNPNRTGSGSGDKKDIGIVEQARALYDLHAKGAVNNLMDFLATLDPGKPCLAVTYFDEAPELNRCFWILLRLLNNQDISKNMWYVFMGTKSTVSHFSPTPKNCESSVFLPI